MEAFLLWGEVVMMVGMEQTGLSQELKRLATDAEDIRALGQSTHIDRLTIKMGQIDAAASIQVKNHSVRHRIAHAAHENPPLLITNVDVILTFGDRRNVVDETIKLEAAHIVEVIGPALVCAIDGNVLPSPRKSIWRMSSRLKLLASPPSFGTTSIRTWAEAMPKGRSVRAKAIKVFFIVRIVF